MSTGTIIAVAFLLLVGVTLFIPSFPPAQLLCEYLTIPQTTLSIWGISIASLFNGIINGFFWILIAATVYSVARYSRERKQLPPMPVAPHLETPPPEPMVVDERVNKIPPSLTVPPVPTRSFVFSSVKIPHTAVRTKPSEVEQDVETIEGVGPVYGGLLRNSGIYTVNDLLRVGAREHGRQQLARKVGTTSSTILRWIYHGDLLRVRGVGRKYAALLESAGVNTVDELSTRNPRYLCQTLKAVNRDRHLVRRTPPPRTIEIWVNHAKTLEPMVQ